MYSNVYLTLINDVPVIGARFSKHEKAVAKAKELMNRVASFIKAGERTKVTVKFLLQQDGCYTLQLWGDEEVITEVPDLDELLLKRFRKAYGNKNMFILTCFVNKNGESERPHCLVTSKGLGVVVYRL
ncbi:MAG: hypothetical protein H0Z39_01230 [Peptococcaceae bacterium]|nr:hypothetical protein [Peptococcaceae bacterium]